MLATLDNELQEKANYILTATQDPSAVTERGAFVGALVEGLADLARSKAAHAAAATAVEDDKAENKAAYLAFDAARQATAAVVVWARDKIKDHLLGLPPAALAALDPLELRRREVLVDTFFPILPHTLKELRASAFQNEMDKLSGRLLGASPEDIPQAASAEVIEAIGKVVVSYKGLVAEQLDDAILYRALEDARGDLRNVTEGQRRLVEAALRFDRNPTPVDDFILKLSKRARPAAPAPGGAPAAEPLAKD